jgi:NADH-quinone oxidoreductase subunit F
VYLISGEAGPGIPNIASLPLFGLQNRVVLRNCGWVDPGDVDHYILSAHGFAALSRALSQSREELIRVFESSALQGHIQTGHSTLKRWKECMESDSPEKYLVCNAATGDPGGCITRMLLGSDPFSVLEGILIGAYTIGASRCMVCIRSGSAAIPNLCKAIETMGEYKFQGSGILDTSFGAKIEIKETAPDYLMGSEFLSLQCIDQGQSDPRLLPGYPAIDALTRSPAVVANPEALAFLPSLFLDRSELQAGFGADACRASRVVTLSGDVAQKSTVEVPCGVSIRRVVEEIGGGVTVGKTLKAVRAGIPTGLLLDPGALETCCHCGTEATIDDGSFNVLDGDADVVEAARNKMADIHEQSCGKCLLCFEGSRQMQRILEDITSGNGKISDLEVLKELGGAMKTGCMCIYGRAASDYVLSSLILFRNDYESRMRGR